jgi:hypothetical protein
MQERLKLPACNHRFDKPIVPYFQPMVVEDTGRSGTLVPDNPSETSTATSQNATLQSPTGVGS